MLKKILLGIAAIMLLLVAYVVDTLVASGAFKTIEPHFEGNCTSVSGVIGAEDITIDHSNGLAYISVHDRRNWLDGGGIYTYHTGSLSQPVIMPHDLEQKFYPHGISLWKNPNGLDRLFVVNHPPAPGDSERRFTSEVIIFDIVGETLKHVRTLKTPLPFSLNDVAAVNSDTFYATIDMGSLTRLGRTMETYGRLARGGIAYGDINGMVKITDGLIYPNGIQVSRDGTKVYVSESTGRRLLTYSRNAQSGELALTDRIRLDSALDNLEWDEGNNLWIGAHPQMLKFVAHGADPAKRSASQVLRVNINNDFAVEEIYLNDGNPLSGSSVAAAFGQRLLIGSVYDPLILDCKMTANM